MNKRMTLFVLVALMAGLAGGYWWAQRNMRHGSAPLTANGARVPLYYRQPMNPSITSPVPKKDEMNMDYIPVYADEGAKDASGTVRINAVMAQNIGVRTAKAERRVLGHVIRAAGRVDYDETRLARLNPKTEGWVQTLEAATTGQQVHRGQTLLTLYSPQLVSAQQEYLLAMQNRAVMQGSQHGELRHGADELADAARARLALLDVPSKQIEALERTGEVLQALPLQSPFAGVLVSVGVRPSQYVTPGSELYTIADLSRVWVYADIYENELPWVRVGDSGAMSLAAAPGLIFKGKVTYIYPTVDAKTRTVRLRLEFANREGLLKPEMFAEVTLSGTEKTAAVAVPGEAVIRSGTRDRVFVVSAPGKFEPREVRLGMSAEGWTEITQGVKVGEEVVTSAQFLIDSESKLSEVTAKLKEPAAPTSQPSSMSDLDMGDMRLDAGGQHHD